MNGLVRKGMGRREWTTILRRAEAYACFTVPGLSGAVGLMRMDQVAQPFCPQLEGRRATVLDTGYQWLQVAPQGEHWWLTTMFDPAGLLVQHYFDITLENRMSPGEEPCFWDLFLDVVLLPEGRAVLLDGDELDAALSAGKITPDQHALAWDTARMLLRELPPNCARLEAFCQDWRARLEPMLSAEWE